MMMSTRRFTCRPLTDPLSATVALSPDASIWLVTRYDDGAAALIDTRLAKDPLNASQDVRARPVWVPDFVGPDEGLIGAPG